MSGELAEIIADVREQMIYMREIGVDRLAADPAALGRVAAARVSDPALTTQAQTSEPSQFSQPPPREIPDIFNKKLAEPTPASTPRDGSRLSSLPSLSKRLTAVPRRKTAAVMPVETPLVASQPLIVEPSVAGVSETVAEIQQEIGPQCMRCKLCELGRTQVVQSTGNIAAELMFAGEAPGADEDEQGFPFVGRAGQLLTKIIESIGVRREDVFIGNINRCRPPGNRAPEPDETAVCRPFLQREIATVQPKVIVVLGATAAHNLLETKTPIGKLRGQFHDYLGSKVMPTFHPAYLLRDPNKKREVWEDMKKVRDYLAAL